jgi:hypothetical protein
MITLVLVWCLRSNPKVCTEHRIAAPENSTMMGCIVNAQASDLAWSEDHPQYRLARTRCEWNVPRQVPA